MAEEVWGKFRRKLTLTITLVFVLVISINVGRVCGDIWDPWHTKEEVVDMFRTLCDAHDEYASYEPVGTTYQGNDIWMFKIGNPEGGTILWDAQIHGSEDYGSEILYLMAQWLLESYDPAAKRILERNYVLFIPVIDVDSYRRGNANTETCQYGVNLNRNFKTGWSSLPCSDVDNYAGAYPASEPETQALRKVFEDWSPRFYVNLHQGLTALWYYRGGNVTLANSIISRTRELADERGVATYWMRGIGSSGFSIGDAGDEFGISSWMMEVDSSWEHTEEKYQELVNTVFPKCQVVFLAMAENCAVTVDRLPPNIAVLSPENTTYTTRSVPLHFVIDEATAMIGYSVDEQTNVTIPGNATLTALSDGSHRVTIYAEDLAGNVGASETAYFTIQPSHEAPAPTGIVAAVVILAVVGAGLLLYLTKKQKIRLPFGKPTKNIVSIA